jgi:hypothetical protein
VQSKKINQQKVQPKINPCQYYKTYTKGCQEKTLAQCDFVAGCTSGPAHICNVKKCDTAALMLIYTLRMK